MPKPPPTPTTQIEYSYETIAGWDPEQWLELLNKKALEGWRYLFLVRDRNGSGTSVIFFEREVV